MNSYFGSKATSGLCQPLIAMMPPHDTYIETHLGGGAIMRRKPPALRNIAIDLDPEALRAFECDYPVEKVRGCAHEFLCATRMPSAAVNWCIAIPLIFIAPARRTAAIGLIIRSGIILN